MEKLPSDQIRYPSHSWGVFALDPAIDVGITGEALARSAFASSGIDIEKLKVRAQQDDVKKRLIDLSTDAVIRAFSMVRHPCPHRQRRHLPKPTPRSLSR
jgi:hypothetical protein